MSPRLLPGVVFLAGIVVGSIVSFFSIHMLSSSSHLRRAEESDEVHHLTREIDVDLLCNISSKALPLHGTDSLASDSLKSAPKEEIHFADELHHHGNFCIYSCQ